MLRYYFWRLVLPLLMRKAKGLSLGSRVTMIGKPIIDTKDGGTIKIGDRVRIVSKSWGTALGVRAPSIIRTLRPNATISIGDETGISGACICAAWSVEIGKRVLIGSDVMIADTDFHPLDPVNRHLAPVPEPSESDGIVIGDDVFIGARAIILKGVTIGERSVIGANSVVTRSIPDGVIAAGNPAVVLRQIL